MCSKVWIIFQKTPNVSNMFTAICMLMKSCILCVHVTWRNHEGHHQTFVSGDVVTNVGGNYNRHSRIFSSPSHGFYVFSWTLYCDAEGYFYSEVVVNSDPVGALYCEIGVYYTYITWLRGWHTRISAPGLSCHLGADILVCHPRSHV